MYCTKCMKEINEKSKYCSHCGNKVIQRTNKKPNTTIVFGVISCIFAFINQFSIVSIIVGIIGLIYGAKCKNITKTPLAFSIVGLSIGSLAFIKTIISTMIAIFYFMFYVFYYILIILLIVFSNNGRGNIPGEFFM